MSAKAKGGKGPKNIRVFLRIRPPNSREIDGKHTFKNIVVDPSDPSRLSLARKDDKNQQGARNFAFSRVFGQQSTNTEVYNEFGKNAVDAAFDGQHGVLFVYGQTGSGKTFTISNTDPNNIGVLQQAMREVWGRIAKDKDHEYRCSLSYVQLYKEVLTDLLDDKRERIRLQTSNDGVEMVKEATGLPTDVAVASYQQTMDLFMAGAGRKEMASTDMNQTSSRSHTIFCLNIHKKPATGPVVSQDVVDVEAPASYELQGRLYLCDLAGSERVSKTKATGNTLDEATSINGSLLVLGKVVAALTDRTSQHAPFRESKLTRILQYSLTGNGNTSLVVNVSPSDDNTDETLSAVLFGQRAIQIKQDAKRHEVVDYKALYLQLQADLDSKNDKLVQSAISEEVSMYEGVIANLKEQLKFAESEKDILKQENVALRAQLGGAAPPAGAAGGQWLSMADDLRGRLAERDTKLREVDSERTRLGLLLADEKQTVYKLAEKFRALLIKYQTERRQWTDESQSLKGDIAAMRGTDFLSPVGPTEDLSPTANASPRPLADGEELQVQLDRAQTALRAMQEERISLIVYQAKAQKAIRVLANENIRLGGSIA